MIEQQEMIERIRARCIECGDCLVWQLSDTNGSPVIRHAGRNHYARRLWWEAHNGPTPKGKVIARTCETHLCVCHCEPMTVAKVAKRTAETGVWALPARCAKIAKARRAQAGKLTDEQAQECRVGSESAQHYADEFGVDVSLVYRIRRGEAWRQYSSPFAGLGA